MTINKGLLVFKCVDCSKTYEIGFDEDLTKRLENTYKLCDRDIKKFCLLLQKGVYPCESMGNETFKDSMKRYCQARKNFTSIWQWKVSRMLITNTRNKSGSIPENLGEYHNLYVRIDIFLVVNISKNFHRNI